MIFENICLIRIYIIHVCLLIREFFFLNKLIPDERNFLYWIFLYFIDFQSFLLIIVLHFQKMFMFFLAGLPLFAVQKFRHSVSAGQKILRNIGISEGIGVISAGSLLIRIWKGIVAILQRYWVTKLIST